MHTLKPTGPTPLRIIGSRDFLPSAQQKWLLRAAFMDEASALDAWQRWCAHTPAYQQGTETHIDGAAQRLLPLIYRRLEPLGAHSDWMPRMRVMYQQTWLKNQWMLRQAGDLVAALHDQQIPTLLLKGLPLALLHYKDLGTRPMGDFDVLVPPDRAGQVIDWLLGHGWRQTTERSRTPSPRYRLSRHSFNFINDQGDGVDVHWFALLSCCYPTADDRWWQDAIAIQVNGVTTRTLCPEDMLFHVCAHATLYDTVAPIRWIADALILLRGTPTGFRWERIIEHARARRLTQPLAEMLNYLQQHFEAPIPLEVVKQLQREPIRWNDARMYELFASNQTNLGQKIARHLHSYGRYVSLWRAATHTWPPLTPVDYLLNQTGLQHPFQLLPLSWRKLTHA